LRGVHILGIGNVDVGGAVSGDESGVVGGGVGGGEQVTKN
jgi:hypothetical protein